jgi:hypothetical protein
VNSNINRIIGRAPFDLVLRFRPEMRMNIEAAATEDSYNVLREVLVARREIELRERDANLVLDCHNPLRLVTVYTSGCRRGVYCR